MHRVKAIMRRQSNPFCDETEGRVRTEGGEHLQLFGRRQVQRVLRKGDRGGKANMMSRSKAIDPEGLLTEVRRKVIGHPIFSNNLYLRRFAKGITLEQARHELNQFSIFAHSFDVAQSQLVVNAPTRAPYCERLKMPLNKKGIPFDKGFGGRTYWLLE